MKLKYLATAILSLGVLISTMGAGCNKPSVKKRTDIANCADEKAPSQEKCEALKQTSDNKECEYDSAANKCRVKIATSADKKYCNDIADENKCRGDKKCTFDDTKTTKCDLAAANILGNCEAIQLDATCSADTTCLWDSAASQCLTKDDIAVCKIKSETDCKTSLTCLFVAAAAAPAAKCKPAGTDKNTCAASEEQAHCNALTVAEVPTNADGCGWRAATSKCEAQVDVHVWTQLAMPGAATAAEISFFTMSKDTNNLYVRSSHGGEEGLYHSADKGNTWARVGAGNHGHLVAKAKAAAADVAMDTTAALIDEIKPTKTGVAIRIANQIIVMEGDQAKWGIEKDINKSNAAHGNSRIPDIKSPNFAFIDVVDLNGVEHVVFAQNDHNNTESRLWAHETTGLNAAAADAPKRIAVQQAVGGALLSAHHVMSLNWKRAGNTHDGNLLLFSNNGTPVQSAIWEIAKANLDISLVAAEATHNAAVVDDIPRLYPEAAGVGVNWVDDNLDVTAIGGLSNGPNTLYFAAMKTVPGATAGLAYYDGPQGGNHANQVFANTLINGVSNSFGVMRVIGSAGLLGINHDGTANAANDLHFAAFSVNTEKMAVSNTAVVLQPAQDQRVRAIYGDDNLSYFQVEANGVAPAGLFRREKAKGLTR